MTKYRCLLFFILLNLLNFSCFAGISQVLITDDFSQKNIGTSLSYLVDSSKTLSAVDVIGGKFDQDFIASTQNTPYIGFLDGAVWVRFIVKNTSPDWKKIYIQYENPLVDQILFYPNGAMQDKSGMAFPYYQRKIQNAKPIFELELQPSEQKLVFLQIINNGIDLSLPITLYSEHMQIKENREQNFFSGFFYGTICFVFLINFFFFVNLRYRIYLFYIIYVASLGMFLLVRDGYAFAWLWPTNYWLAKQSAFIFVELPLGLVILLEQNALDLKVHLPKTHKLLNVLIAILFTLCVVSAFFQNPLYELCNISAILVIIPMLIISAKMLRNKDSIFAKYFFIGLLFMIFGSVVLIVKNYGAIEYETGELIFKFGFVMQLIVYSLGLAAVYKKIINDLNKTIIHHLEEKNASAEKAKSELALVVQENTKELETKNQQLRQTIKQLAEERDILESQRNLIAKQRQETTDSIKYALRIQQTLIPQEKSLQNLFNDVFVLNMPKDIVSGDFYWTAETEAGVIVVVADCTGHGVPGAFMSIIGMTYLKEIILVHNEREPHKILFKLRERIVDLFHQSVSTEEGTPKDGMDMSLALINKANGKLYFAGAYNSMYLVRNNQIFTIQADKMPIGVTDKQSQEFKTQEVDINRGDILYLSTDGFVDQFGWRSGKKYKHNNFKELLLEMSELPLEAQKVVIHRQFSNWKGDLEQVDDVLVIGIKV